MLFPQLNFKRSNDDEVAVMMNLVPTFEPPQPQEFCQAEEPSAVSEINGEEFSYVFIVDRSGSMGGQRMEIAKEALQLFIQSLPPRSEFAICSFGSNFNFYSFKGNHQILYDDLSMKAAKEHIAQMDANFGGTNILEPLVAACQTLPTKRNKRVFLLTDGQVGDTNQVIEYARS